MGTNISEETGELDLPFGWDERPEPDRPTPGGVFRFPAEGDPVPGSRRLLAMATYASVLGLLGLAVAVRGFIAIMGGTAPGWYEPTLIAAAIVGVAFVVGAFLSIHRRVLPWLMLGLAAAPLAVNIAATVLAV